MTMYQFYRRTVSWLQVIGKTALSKVRNALHCVQELVCLRASVLKWSVYIYLVKVSIRKQSPTSLLIQILKTEK